MSGRLAVLIAALLWSTSGLFMKSPEISAMVPADRAGPLIALWRSWGLEPDYVSLALLISAPLQLAAVAKPPDGVSVADWIGLSVFTIGFFFEVVADRQLQVFRRNPQNEGKVLASGLWRLSRHPNYFGEAVLWWGLWLCAVDEPWGWMAVLSPVLMTFLLLRVSGVAMLEPQLAATKPGYAAYVATTSTFVPRKPHRPDSGG